MEKHWYCSKCGKNIVDADWMASSEETVCGYCAAEKPKSTSECSICKRTLSYAEQLRSRCYYDAVTTWPIEKRQLQRKLDIATKCLEEVDAKLLGTGIYYHCITRAQHDIAAVGKE